MSYGPRSLSASEIVRYAEQNPPKPVIHGLLYENNICLIHGVEECFKSVLVLQIAESIATGRPLLRRWKIRTPQKVGIIETEMNSHLIGARLGKMFPDQNVPKNIHFMTEESLREWRRLPLDKKFKSIETWVKQEEIKVLLVDTANDFFRGADDPSRETAVGSVFDEFRNLNLSATFPVRHDRKHRENDTEVHSNEKIRGSAEWKEDPELILYLNRKDRRTHEVYFEVGKFRYGCKPEPMTLWFDVGTFRLTPLPPVIAILESGPKTRQQLIGECKHRFGIGHTVTDEHIASQKGLLREQQRGHEKVYQIDRDKAQDAPWGEFLEGSVQDTEHSVICTPQCKQIEEPILAGVVASEAMR